MRSSQQLAILAFLALVASSSAHRVGPTAPTTSPSPGPSGPASGLESNPTTFKVGLSLKEWCNSTDYPDLCESAIAPSMNGKPDLSMAVEIAIKSTVDTTKKALLAATTVSKSHVMAPQFAEALKDSMGSLESALDAYKTALEAMPEKDWGTVNTMLSGAITDFGDCEEWLKNEDLPLLKGFFDKLTKMTSNCLALSALIDPPPGYFF